MAKRSTKKKLDQLTEAIGQLATQIERLQTHLSQLTPMADSSDQTGLLSQPLAPIDLAATQSASLDRTEALEAQVRRLGYRLQILEQQELVAKATAAGLPNPLDDDEIEDEPDEVLWDFIEPSARK